MTAAQAGSGPHDSPAAKQPQAPQALAARFDLRSLTRRVA